MDKFKRAALLIILLTLVGGPVGSTASFQTVRFAGADAFPLVGTFHAPEKGHPTILLLHGLGSTKEEWRPFSDRMASLGWGVLAYDARGHGKSAPPTYRSFGRPAPESPWEKMIDDVGRAIHFLEKDQGVDRSSIYLAGASLGANVALNYAALTRSVRGVILLSPGITYQGVRTDKPSGLIRRTPVLLVVSPPDFYAYKSCLQLKKNHPAFDLWTDVKDGHGVQMFDSSLLSRLSEWLLKHR